MFFFLGELRLGVWGVGFKAWGVRLRALGFV